MKKGIRLIRRMLALFLVLLLSIESFGAIVSDNDGSAFITKAEFDSLKNDFQTQIDQYNTSIDAKIDGAIAAYLAGIKMTKKTDVPLVVSNYDEILWKRKFDFYGGRTVYANASSIFPAENIWFEPEFQEYMNYRDKTMDGMFQWNRWQYGYIVGIRYKTNFPEVRNASIIQGDPYADDIHVATPIYLRCEYDSIDEIILGSRYHGDEVIGTCWAYDSYHGANPIVGASPDQWNGSGWTAMSNNARPLAPITESGETTMGWQVVEPLELGANDVIAFNVYCNRDNTRSGWARLGGRWTIKEFNPAIPQCASLESDIKKRRTLNPTNMSEVAPDTFSRLGGRVRSFYIEPDTGQSEKIKYTMFGDDVNMWANILRQSDVKVGRTPQMRTDLSNWVTVKATVLHVTLASSARWHIDNDTERNDLESKGITFDLKYPYFERYLLKNITSAVFKNGSANLKFGEGIPISTYLNGKGTLTISFDYSIGRTAQTVPSGEDKRIKVDVKKSNFLTGTNDYYTGKVDNATTAVELKNAASGSNTSQKSKIVIENVKEGEEVWIRIAPYSTTDGLYAQMSNLTAGVETED